MKTEFDCFFSKLNNYSKKMLDTKPLTPYTEKSNKDLIVSEPDEEGYVEWQPKLQDKEIEWDKINEVTGLVLNPEIKEYYSTYSFASLNGVLNDIHFHFDSIDDTEPIIETIVRQYEEGQSMFPDREILALGIAIIDGDDGYTIYYDNITRKLFCYENDKKKTVDCIDPLTTIIGKMEARL